MACLANTLKLRRRGRAPRPSGKLRPRARAAAAVIRSIYVPAAARSASTSAFSCRTRPAGMPGSRLAQAREHRRLLGAGHQPQDAPGAIDRRVSQGHAAPALIDAGHRDVRVGGREHRIARHERSGVPVGAEPEVDEVEHRRCTCDLAQRRGVARGRVRGVRKLDRHRVHLPRGERRPLEQALGEVRQVAVGVAGRRDALVDLEEVHVFPRHVGHLRQRLQHHPRGAAAAERDGEAAAGGDRRARLAGDEGGAGPRDRVGVGEDFDLHAAARYAATVGFTQPPGGVTVSPTSCGPQAPGSYSFTGVPLFSTGSTMRQASST